MHCELNFFIAWTMIARQSTIPNVLLATLKLMWIKLVLILKSHIILLETKIEAETMCCLDSSMDNCPTSPMPQAYTR